MNGKTLRLTGKELFYFERLKSIGINPSQYFRLAFQEKINKDYKEIEIAYKKTLKKDICPF